ncbi:hypothetical protein M426DRAFT_322697 [Hypoxylon sp. CI-4A]|nr:hypothetical protein M426DRAFT_322697 [Hypoxylon sp. CI-4A]
MHFSNLLPSLLLLLPTTLASTQACKEGGNCKTSCGWYCNLGCDAPLNWDECSRCQYCRRESSSCDFIYTGDTSTQDPPSDELCAACSTGCWCHGDWYCMDNGTTPPEGSRPTTTTTPVLARATLFP